MAFAISFIAQLIRRRITKRIFITMASVEVTGHELRETQGTPPFVAYTIVVTPSGEGEPYSTTRRWNDLRRCHDALRAAGHGSRLSTLPKVEAHSLRMLLPGAAQDKVFRDERATQMQEFVNAACTAFDVVIDAAKPEEGPAPLLDFLRRDVPEPGVEPTPQHEKASHDGIASECLRICILLHASDASDFSMPVSIRIGHMMYTYKDN